MWCIVNLPNGTQQAVKWDPKAIGQECLEKVCKALGIICEMEYFGLEHWTPNQKESRTRQWINLRNRLSCDSSSGIQLMLALRVKFWVPVHFILQESVRNLFYMQAKVDLLERRLGARDWTNAAKLSALLCQADGIRFNELSLKAKCPIRMQKEHELFKQQQPHQQQQQQQQQKERKEKEYVLSFKKRRLSKQKSVECIENASHAAAAAAAASAALSSQSQQAAATLAAQTYSLSAPTVAAATSSNISTTQTPTSSSANSSSSSSAPAAAILTSSSSASSSPTNNNSTNSCIVQQATNSVELEERLATSPLRCYQDYIVRPSCDFGFDLPEDFLRQIATEHGKLSKLKMTAKSAKYWLLQEIQDLPGYGEEVFSGVTTNENSIRCDIAVGANGITVCKGDEKNSIPFSAIAAAKSFRRTFKLEYVDDHNDRKDLEIKLPKHAIAAGLYRSITERHAFYVCDKVRGVVTNQFTRDLKGTIASMFKEDTELGKRYVFDIQHTCREVHDQARRLLHERGIEITNVSGNGFDDIANYLPKSASLLGGAATAAAGEATETNVASCSTVGLGLGASGSLAGKLDLAIREKEEREAAIERCVDTRISEAMTCKICMDRAINTMFNPCCHVIACAQCAARCGNCPNCRVKITSVVKIYLPPELRTSQSSSIDGSSPNSCGSANNGNAVNPATTSATPKLGTAA